MAMTMAADDKDNVVDGDSATSDDDGNGATGDYNDGRQRWRRRWCVIFRKVLVTSMRQWASPDVGTSRAVF